MKNKVTYLYFDDNEETAIGVKDNLENKSLLIEVKREQPWDEILEYLLDNEKTFQGLILDWRLDAEDDSRANFSSEALAQQCRRLQVDKIKDKGFRKSFPIILCSAQAGFSARYERDTTGEDLFDGVFDKSDLEDQSNFLLELISAYELLNKDDVPIESILGLAYDEIDLVNYDLIRKVNETKEQQPHETIQFLLNEVIGSKGVLICENILAARLGVDKSSDGWQYLKQEMELFKYKGLLSGTERWWADLVNEWWLNTFNGSILKYISSSERISLLETRFKNLKDQLFEPELSNGSVSKEFWTICYGTGVPLSETDGFMIDHHFSYSWQEKEYLSLDEAKNETHRGTKWKSLLPYEEERLQLYFKKQ